MVAIGFSYEGKVWREAWPKAIGNFVAACEATGARMVFIDNLYMYGPQTAPLVETMPLTSYGAKPAARSAATRIWMEAAAAGRARIAALRAPDFYGPNVGLAFLGDTSIGALAKGKSAFFIGSPDIPHDFAYVPDIGRAATTLLDAPDSAFGQAWHVPCAPTLTTREILKPAADALGIRLRLMTLPEGLSARRASSRLSCASSRRCASPGTGRIMLMQPGSPGLSGRTRRRSRPACARLRCPSAWARGRAGAARSLPVRRDWPARKSDAAGSGFSWPSPAYLIDAAIDLNGRNVFHFDGRPKRRTR